MSTAPSSSTPQITANWNQQYRPRRVIDLHLNSVRTSLLNLLTSAHFPQSMLFAGPKGTGKTSVARIIGALLNDAANEQAVEQRFLSKSTTAISDLVEPDASSPLAQSIYTGQSYIVHELDAASNRGIDDIRSLKERSALPPSQGKISVFILDEVHMLTLEAFNALLKLLEEPPVHAVFILATTELHKLPATIVSRCHVIQFHKASTPELIAPLKAIIENQGLSVDATSLETIAAIADGSFRDAVKLLQQFVQQGASPDNLAALTQTMSSQHVAQLLQAVVDKNSVETVSMIESLRKTGADEQHFLRAVLTFLHVDVLRSHGVAEGKNHFNEKIARFFLQQLIQPDLLKPSPIPFLRLELVLLDIIDRARSKSESPGKTSESKPRSANQAEAKTAPTAATTEEKMVVLVEPVLPQEILSVASDAMTRSADPPESSAVNSDVPLGDGQLLCEKWSELIAKAGKYNFGLAALLRSAQPIGGGEGEVVVRVYYTFHKEQLLQKKWRKFWDDLTQEIVGGAVALDCVVEAFNPAEAATAAQQSPGVSLEALAVDALMQ